MAGPHRLSEIDDEARTAWCSECETLVKIRISVRNSGTKVGYIERRCRNAYLATEKAKERPWRAHKKDHCEECGFVAVWRGQLHVDHIDGNNTNNNPENFRTLCANCHALKTHRKGDAVNRAFRQ